MFYVEQLDGPLLPDYLSELLMIGMFYVEQCNCSTRYWDSVSRHHPPHHDLDLSPMGLKRLPTTLTHVKYYPSALL